MEIPLPRLRFAEPAGGNPVRSAAGGEEGEDEATGASGSDRSHRPSGGAADPIVPLAPRAASTAMSQRRSPLSRPSIISLSGRAGMAAAAAAIAARQGGGDGGVSDAPRFAPTLKKLTAVKTRLWNRWDLATFPRLTALEVSFAGKTMLKQLHRKVGGISGSWQRGVGVYLGAVLTLGGGVYLC